VESRAPKEQDELEALINVPRISKTHRSYEKDQLPGRLTSYIMSLNSARSVIADRAAVHAPFDVYPQQ
jgi:hypothetical protein